MWQATASAILLITVVIGALVMLVRRRRARVRIRDLAELRARGRLPDDVELALRRASSGPGGRR